MMLLHDKPESTDIRFGHKVVSDWLAKQIESVKPPFRLAITGGLGTGKSTILQSALAQIESEKRDHLAVAYVDVWKLDKDSVRRSALIRIAKDLLKDGSHVEKLRESLYGTFSEASYIRPFRKTIDKTGLRISGGIFAVVFLAAYLVLNSLPGTGEEPWWWKSIVSALIAGFNLATKFLEKSIVHVQRTFNRAPMVGAEEFEEGLQKILDDPALANKQVVLLFDNIDRAAPDSSRAILSGISAFFDHSSHAKLRNVLIIVPFDPSCLELASEGDRPIIDDCEKMFDAIVPLPKLTIEDLSDFAFDNLKEALGDFNYEEDVLRDLAYLVSFSPFRSPREIKHMVNQLFSRLDLARALESNVDTRLPSSATLLPQGSVTQHPDALFKLQICEKIFSEFTESVVNHGIDLKRAFDVGDESLILKSDILNDSAKKVLADFLNATTGIPKNPPQSAAPFLYMKGPDQVVSIPSGQLISDALYMNDAGKLKSAVAQADGKNLSHENIANVIRFHRKKYAKNVQALKNAAKAIFSGLSEVSKFEKSLAIEVCEVLALVPEILTEISPKVIAKHTNEYLEVGAVQKVWKILDAEFKKMLDPARLSSDGASLKWSSEYFDAVFHQPDGLKRSGLEAGKLPYPLILTDAVVSSLGENYPGIYCRPEDVLESVKRYIAGSDQKNFEKYKRIVSRCFSSTPDFEGAEKVYQEISTGWQASGENWLNGTDKALVGERLATVAFSWPGNSPKGKPYFDQIKGWVASKVANFHQKANNGFGAVVLDITLAFYSSGVNDGNFDSITQHTLGQIKRDQLIELRTRYGSPSKQVWEMLQAKAQQQVITAIDRTAAFDLLVEDKANKLLQAIITGFQGITNKDALLDALLVSDALADSLKGVAKFFSAVQENSRVKFINLLIKTNVDQSNLRAAFEHFVKSPDGSNERIFTIAQGQNIDLKKALTEAAIQALASSPINWTDKEARTFLWLNLVPSEFLDVKLKDPIELGLERGAINGQSDNVKSMCTELVLHMWKNQPPHGYSEKSFRILKKSAPDRFANEIDEIGKANGVKTSIFENIADKVTEVIGG